MRTPRPARKTWPRITQVTDKRTGKSHFMVDGRWRRTGAREYFAKKEDAQTRADQLAIERTNAGGESLNFSTELRAEALKAQKRLAPFAASISQAVDHYIGWRETEKAKHDSLLVEECVDRYLKARRDDHAQGQLSKLSMYEITARMNQVASTFRGVHVRELTPERMKAYLHGFPVSARTRQNIRLRLSNWFNWCRDQGFVTSNPVERMKIKVPESEIRTLSVPECEKLLRAAEDSKHDDLVAFVSLGLFGAMRPGEVAQLHWEHVDFKTRTIEVRPETSKVRKRRIFAMHPTLVSWLKPIRRDSGPIVEPNFRKRCGAKLKGLGVNVLRHTGASMALARFQNRSQLAEDLGTSVEVIAKFYRRPVPKKDATRFFKLRSKTI